MKYGLICPKGSNILRAKIQRALRRAPRQLRRLRLGLQTRRGSNHSAAHVSESNSRSNVFQISRACVPSRWKVLSGEFRRPPDFRTLYGLKWATGVEKRHELPISEVRLCSACANLFACPAVGKFSRASSAGGRRRLQRKLANQIVSVAEDCLSPERTFHG